MLDGLSLEAIPKNYQLAIQGAKFRFVDSAKSAFRKAFVHSHVAIYIKHNFFGSVAMLEAARYTGIYRINRMDAVSCCLPLVSTSAHQRVSSACSAAQKMALKVLIGCVRAQEWVDG